VEDHPWEVRTACFPYPGNVELRTKEGNHILGEVLLSVALSKTREMVTLEEATKWTAPQILVQP
jgi:hypothetical protein